MSEVSQAMQSVFEDADCLITGDQLKQAIESLSHQISKELAAENPLVLCVMNGGLVFCGQLLPHFKFPLQLDYIHASRYGHETEGSALNWKVEPHQELEGRNILIVDDIFDEGTTIVHLHDFCIERGAKSVKTAVMLSKRHERKHPRAHVDYIALEVEDRFIFGFGLDYKGYWRNAPGIYAVKGL